MRVGRPFSEAAYAPSTLSRQSSGTLLETRGVHHDGLDRRVGLCVYRCARAYRRSHTAIGSSRYRDSRRRYGVESRCYRNGGKAQRRDADFRAPCRHPTEVLHDRFTSSAGSKATDGRPKSAWSKTCARLRTLARSPECGLTRAGRCSPRTTHAVAQWPFRLAPRHNEHRRTSRDSSCHLLAPPPNVGSRVRRSRFSPVPRPLRSLRRPVPYARPALVARRRQERRHTRTLFGSTSSS